MRVCFERSLFCLFEASLLEKEGRKAVITIARVWRSVDSFRQSRLSLTETICRRIHICKIQIEVHRIVQRYRSLESVFGLVHPLELSIAVTQVVEGSGVATENA